MTKIDGKALIKALQARKGGKKGNFTFRFDKPVLKAFKKECKAAGLSMSEVLEEFMKQFTK